MFLRLRHIALIQLILLSMISVAQFTEVASEMGIGIVQDDTEYGNGLSFYDFNHDGWDDLTIANDIEPIQFYINNHGTLELAEISLNYQPVGHVVMILWGDIDNDGDSDLLTTELEGEVHLWQNDGDFNFVDITADAGLPTGSWRFRGAAFADYDHDGFLDLYLSKYYTILNNFEEQYKSKLFRNNGDSTFEDVTVQAGVDLATSPNFQPVFFDYDYDGWEDLYLVIDRNFFMNRLFHNNHDGTFSDVSVGSGVNPSIDAMSGTVGDYDNDGDLDVFIANGWPGNHLYENNGNGTYTNIATTAGVMVQMICWGSLWIDYDNDSWRDLYIGTTGSFYGAAQSRFFINNRDDTFTPGEEITGIGDHSSAVMVASMGDVNRDGYYDFVTNSNDPFPSEFWLNNGGENNFLSVHLEGVVSNRDGVGSWIHCYAGDQHFVEFTRAGDSFNSQSSSSYIFGLDSIAVIDTLRIEWNSGIIDRFYQLPVNQHIVVVEGISHEADIDAFQLDTLYLCQGDTLILDAGNFGSYLWSTGDTTQQISIHEAGEYYVTLPGIFSIPTESDHVHVIVVEPQMPIAELISPSCHGGENGSITIVTDTIFESVYWPQFDISGPTITQVASGNYSYTVSDFHSCVYNGTIELTDPPAPTTWVEALHSTCAHHPDGEIILSLEGDSIASVIWSDGAAGQHRVGLSGGFYAYEIITAQGCQVTGEITLTEPDSMMLNYAVTAPTCFGLNDGSVTIDVSGGIAPYEYVWNGQNPDALFSGMHAVNISDASGCETLMEFEIPNVLPLQYEVNTSPEIENGILGSAILVPIGGTPPYSFDPPGSGDGIYESLSTGLYQVVVTDSLGCNILSEFFIDFVAQIGESADDNIRLFVVPELNTICSEIHIVTMQVFDQNGKLISIKENGFCFEFNELSDGLYIVKATDHTGKFGILKWMK